jgi:hypothetical protein
MVTVKGLLCGHSNCEWFCVTLSSDIAMECEHDDMGNKKCESKNRKGNVKADDARMFCVVFCRKSAFEFYLLSFLKSNLFLEVRRVVK